MQLPSNERKERQTGHTRRGKLVEGGKLWIRRRGGRPLPRKSDGPRPTPWRRSGGGRNNSGDSDDYVRAATCHLLIVKVGQVGSMQVKIIMRVCEWRTEQPCGFFVLKLSFEKTRSCKSAIACTGIHFTVLRMTRYGGQDRRARMDIGRKKVEAIRIGREKVAGP